MNQAPSLRELDCRLAARLREFYKLTDTHQADSHADLPARCSFRHGLRRATVLREEGFGFPHNPNLSLPLGEMSRSDREGRLPP